MLQRRLGLLQAVSLNMSMMVGIGPFITIPTLAGHAGRPPGDDRLDPRRPGRAGRRHGLERAGRGVSRARAGPITSTTPSTARSRVGRLLKFLFVWQFFFSGPLEIATGAIGMAQYLGYFFPVLGRHRLELGDSSSPASSGKVTWGQVAAMGVMALVTVLAYRRIAAAGRLMVVLWVGMLVTVAWVIVTGLTHFDAAPGLRLPRARLAGRPPHGSIGLGMALAIAMYDFLGYYQVCYLGDEVADAPRTIPRSILISVVAVGLVYLAMNVGILGVLPWREVVESKHIASDLMLRSTARAPPGSSPCMIIWTALASVFAAMLGYSRIPYASARAGHFFQFFAATHPTGEFPHRSLLLIGGMATVACLADLETVITALLTSRILIQFVGQIATVFYLRSHPNGRQAGIPHAVLSPAGARALLRLALCLRGFEAERRGLWRRLGRPGRASFLIWDHLTRSGGPGDSSDGAGSLASPPTGE